MKNTWVELENNVRAAYCYDICEDSWEVRLIIPCGIHGSDHIETTVDKVFDRIKEETNRELNEFLDNHKSSSRHDCKVCLGLK